MLKSKKLITYFLLALIFILAIFLRFYNLSFYPVGFHQDEASLGYNGYSLMLTNKDDNGNKFPLYIDMFGDNRPSGYHYLTIIPIKLFGLNEFATRFPGAFFGSITVIAVFFFVFSIFKDKTLGLISSFLVAIAPWSLVLSRASAEAIVALFFIIAGFGLFFYSLKNKKTIYVFLSAILMVASFLFYHTPRVFVPGLFLVFILMFFSSIKKSSKNYIIAVFSSFIFVSMIAVFLVFGVSGGTGRYSQVNIFSSFETNFFQKQQIQEDAIAGSNNIESRFFHNKVTNVALVFASNYLDYFGFNFLFTKGGLPIWYSVPRVGLLYLVELPFIFIGIYNLIREKNTYYKIPLVWFLIAPMVSAITMDDVPNINRAIMMFPMLEVIAGFGFLSFVRSTKYKKQIFTLITFFLMLNFLYFLHQYFYNAKTSKPWYRNNGFSEMMDVVKENYSKYDLIVMSKYQGGIYPLVLFYMQYDPKHYQEEGSPKNKDYGGFGKFFFVPQDCPSVQRNDKTPKVDRILYIDKGDCPFDKIMLYKELKYVNREDGTKAFRIVYD
ncbi:MAG: glycosyltransferase family 39 protein [bacterium]|nr:glycosyltransferase family 39 protein [bacterium]